MKTGYVININHKNCEIVSIGAKAKRYVRVETKKRSDPKGKLKERNACKSKFK